MYTCVPMSTRHHLITLLLCTGLHLGGAKKGHLHLPVLANVVTIIMKKWSQKVRSQVSWGQAPRPPVYFGGCLTLVSRAVPPGSTKCHIAGSEHCMRCENKTSDTSQTFNRQLQSDQAASKICLPEKNKTKKTYLVSIILVLIN